MKEENSIHERLKIIEDYYNLSDNDLGKIAGVSGVMIGKYLKGISEPGYKTIVNILSYYDKISKQWFLFGEGEMFREETKEPHRYIEDRLKSLENKMDILLEKSGIKIDINEIKGESPFRDIESGRRVNSRK